MSYIAITIYGIATIIFLLLGIIIVYHLIKYGFVGDATKFMIVIFIIVSALLVIVSSVYVAKTNWNTFNFQDTGTNALSSDKPILGY